MIVSGGTVSTSKRATALPSSLAGAPREGRAMVRRHRMVTVEANEAGVERRLRDGQLTCPGCAAALTGWGHGRERTVRGLSSPVRVRPRRSRYTACGSTHMLLPVGLLVRRADEATVIGSALAAKAAGSGYRSIAAGLGRPVDTVRGWLRRFAGRVESVRGVFTVWLRALAADPVMPEPAGDLWADALAALAAAARAVAGRFGVPEVPVWELAVAISGGRLLAPGWPEKWINTSYP